MIFRGKKEKKKNLESVAKAVFIRKAIFFVATIVICFFGIRACYRFMTGWDAEKHKKFLSLEMGFSISIVEETLGRPNRVGEYELESLPVTGYDQIKEDSVRSGARTYYYYENGMNNLYVLGFDARGRMVFKKHIKA